MLTAGIAMLELSNIKVKFRKYLVMLELMQKNLYYVKPNHELYQLPPNETPPLKSFACESNRISALDPF